MSHKMSRAEREEFLAGLHVEAHHCLAIRRVREHHPVWARCQFQGLGAWCQERRTVINGHLSPRVRHEAQLCRIGRRLCNRRGTLRRDRRSVRLRIDPTGRCRVGCE